MTPRQLQLFRFVRDTIERTGEAPTYPEMREALGCASHGNIHAILTGIIERGHLVRVPATKRGLRLATQPSNPLRAVAFRMEDDILVKRFTLTPAGWVAE